MLLCLTTLLSFQFCVRWVPYYSCFTEQKIEDLRTYKLVHYDLTTYGSSGPGVHPSFFSYWLIISSLHPQDLLGPSLATEKPIGSERASLPSCLHHLGLVALSCFSHIKNTPCQDVEGDGMLSPCLLVHNICQEVHWEHALELIAMGTLTFIQLGWASALYKHVWGEWDIRTVMLRKDSPSERLLFDMENKR